MVPIKSKDNYLCGKDYRLGFVASFSAIQVKKYNNNQPTDDRLAKLSQRIIKSKSFNNGACDSKNDFFILFSCNMII